MKRTGLFVLLLAMPLLLPLHARAQAQKPAAAPVAAPAAPAAADAPKRPSRAHEDARACLQHATNREIHQCAEQYR